jgi:hypothetical protein
MRTSPPMLVGEIDAWRGRPQFRSPLHIIVADRSRPRSRCARVMGTLVPLPGRAKSAGQTPVVSCAQGQRTGPVDPSSLSADGHFLRSARLLPLEPRSSALPLSYPDVSGQVRDSNPRPLVEEQNDRAAAYRVRNAAVPWGAMRPSSGPARPVFPLCLPFRTRCFVLKAQYVKNVFVPGLSPAASF